MQPVSKNLLLYNSIFEIRKALYVTGAHFKLVQNLYGNIVLCLLSEFERTKVKCTHVTVL